MKKYLFTILALLIVQVCFSQEDLAKNKVAKAKIQVDLGKIKGIETTIKSNQIALIDDTATQVVHADKTILLSKLNNPHINEEAIEFYIEKIWDLNLLFWTYEGMIKLINDSKNCDTCFITGYRRNLKIVEKQINYATEDEFCLYKFNPTSNQLIKSVYFYHDNDYLVPLINKDKNYSGGGSIEVTTDYFKMRFINYPRKYYWLTYQGIFFGVEAYTPDLRLQDMRDTARANTIRRTHVDSLDRPFASYQYIGRSKYRIHYRLPIKVNSNFRVGKVGGNMGNMVQSVIHRDQMYKSVKPYGWDKQIANGGRFSWNFFYESEVMLWSRGSTIMNYSKNGKGWFNVSSLGELSVGNFETHVGVGFRLSNLTFKEQSGNYDIKFPDWFVYSITARYRYVIHNTSLEGFGLFDTFPNDDDPQAPRDAYKLKSNEINRNLFISELSLGFRTNKTTIFYKTTFYTQEYKKANAQKFYAWGRLGFSFLL